MELLILGLLGTAILGSLAFDWFDDDDNPEENPGEELNFDGRDVLFGTEGDDTIPAGQDSALAPVTIDLRGGDDIAVIEYNDDITVVGGDGDDIITATGVLNELYGGAGNDTLTADDSNRLFGGAGNDELTFIHGSYDQGEDGGVYGGEGDDTITVRAPALAPNFGSDIGGVDVSGGNGSDEINIVYDFIEHPNDEQGIGYGPDPSTNYAGDYVRITDFDPTEDSLAIEVRHDPETVDRGVTVTLDQTTREDGGYISLITLTFEATVDAAEATNVLRVSSVVPFTLDDIEINGV